MKDKKAKPDNAGNFQTPAKGKNGAAWVT